MLLHMALAIAVPSCIEYALMFDGEPRRLLLLLWGENAVEAITSQGDAILYRDPATVDTFVQLARGLAVLAFAPGGVHAFDALWCAAHYVWGTSGMAVCDMCAEQGQTRDGRPERPIINLPSL